MSSTTPPPAGGPEFLDPDDGRPADRSSGEAGGGRRTVAIGAAAAVGLALVGGGVWAAMSFFATGSQPAEALPASTVGYASLDLDPSGDQKVEAFRMIQKFPALERELDGLDADDDLLAKIFEEIEAECDSLDYADDVQPWIGKRFAVAAVDLGEDRPTPVGVLQVSDSGAAGDGLAELQQCSGSDVGGWAIDGDWAVVAETEALADEVVEAAGESTLADDATFQQWTDEAGDPGVMGFYVAPGAGAFLADALGSGAPLEGFPMPQDGDGMDDSSELSGEMTKALEDFQGLAATVRFDEGAVEIETAGGPGAEQLAAFSGGSAADSVGTLPDDTAVAFGIGLPDGWFQGFLEQAERFSGGEMTADEMLAELEAQTGLTGDDLETLLGESTAVALSSDLDPAAIFGSSDGSDLPVGVKIKGDADAVQDVLDRIRGQVGPDEATFLGSDGDDEFVAVGPNADYRQSLLADGGLGDSDVFQNVVREADQAGAILFVNFDAGDWLTRLAGGDARAKENIEPLEGLGLSSWVEDGTGHAVFRLTTD